MTEQTLQPVPLDLLLASLPNEWPDADLTAAIQHHVTSSRTKIIVLDDDPTGTQTVHDVLVVTEWSVPTLEAALRRPEPVVFILTNSRSVPLAQAQDMNREIARNLSEVARGLGCPLEVISRSDSTLRGHFPGEVDALRDGLEEGLGVRYDGYVIVPALLEAGRYTINNIHWVRDGHWAIPASQTEFARDASFGYRSSDLREWVAEKTGGRMAADRVVAVTLSDIRGGGPRQVARVLGWVEDRGAAIVNIASYQDMAVFVAGLLEAEQAGKRFVFRTAASFVRVRGGIAPQPLLSPDRLYVGTPPTHGGLIVVGSYIQKSTEQLHRLLALSGMAAIELSVPAVLDPARRAGEIGRVAQEADRLLPSRDVVIMTSRDLVTGATREESLRIGASVSSALVDAVGRIETTPRFIVAKGGITSSDIATRALGIRRALVLGQIAPAVPVWRPAEGSRFPDVPYVVFPGNVGTADTLADVVRGLRSEAIASPHA